MLLLRFRTGVGEEIRRLIALIVCLAAMPALAQNQSPAVSIFSRYAQATAYVEAVGTLFNGDQETSSGSGLLIGRGALITNSHVIPEAEKYKDLTILVRLKSRLTAPIVAKLVARDSTNDLALLEISSPEGPFGAECPIPVITDPAKTAIGAEIFALGYPLDQDLSIVDGLVSNKSGKLDRWQTNTLINVGNSGGPIFNETGGLIGFVVSGIVQWKFGDRVVDVDGVNFLIPLKSLLMSNIYADFSARTGDPPCWSDQAGMASIDKSRQSGTFARTYIVDFTKDDHPVVLASHSRTYERQLNAEPGYRITNCELTEISANHSDHVTCRVAEDGKSALFLVQLTSGPAVDRWRGWWGGSIRLTQDR